jgi:Rab-GTPase-TBC domain
LQCSVFLFEWVVTVYSNIFPLSISARLWDSWLLYGEFFFIKVCLGVCLCLWEQVTENGGYEMLIILFKSIDKYVTEENLFTKIDELKLTEKEYEKVKQQVFATPDLEKLI